jgi:hypothetical protein
MSFDAAVPSQTADQHFWDVRLKDGVTRSWCKQIFDITTVYGRQTGHFVILSTSEFGVGERRERALRIFAQRMGDIQRQRLQTPLLYGTCGVIVCLIRAIFRCAGWVGLMPC